jgi:cytochrome b561
VDDVPDLATKPLEQNAAPPAKPGIKERLNNLMAEYGSLALYVYFTIFALVLVGFALAIQFGFKTDGTAATAGTWGAAWLATKLTQPLRIGATLLLTPVVGNVRRRLRGGARNIPR